MYILLVYIVLFVFGTESSIRILDKASFYWNHSLKVINSLMVGTGWMLRTGSRQRNALQRSLVNSIYMEGKNLHVNCLKWQELILRLSQVENSVFLQTKSHTMLSLSICTFLCMQGGH